MAEYVVMPKEDYEAACNSIRGKTGKTDLIKSGDLSAEIDSIQTGGSGGGSAEGCVTVTFMNGDVELFSRPVYIGDDCPEPVAQGRFDAPTKESTAQYNYTFYGWGASDGGAADANILKNITSDKTVYAIFTATVRYYTITYYDEDGTTVLKTESLAYGAMPSYTPTKESAVFSGWDKELATVTGDASYTASWIEVIGGSCGDNVNWMYDASSGALTIYGSGAMTNYTSSSPAPWDEYKEDITTVSVNEGVSHIGNYAFRNCTSMNSITIAETVTSIGGTSLAGCSSLTDITIPDSVATIGGSAFASCTALENLTLGKSVGYTANSNYSWVNGCNNLEGIWVDAENPNLCSDEYGVLYDKSMTTLLLARKSISGSYTVPDGVTKVGYYAFGNCTGLTSVTLPDSMRNIDDDAFKGCSGLTESPLIDGITRVGSWAFANCTGITRVTIYQSITTLGAYNHSGSGLIKNTSSVVMQVTSGWWHADTENGASKGTIPESQFTNATTRRKMFTSLGYAGYWWHRS